MVLLMKYPPLKGHVIGKGLIKYYIGNLSFQIIESDPDCGQQQGVYRKGQRHIRVECHISLNDRPLI